MKNLYFYVITVIIFVISGCAIIDGSSIVTGNVRSPISSDSVRIYRVAPEKYEEIAIVNASAGHDFQKNSSLMNSVIQRAKEEAAKLGANGILLTEINERDAPNVITNYGSVNAVSNGSSASVTGSSTSVNRGDSYTRLRGVAIYVP